MDNNFKLLGIKISNINNTDTLEKIEKYLKKGEGGRGKGEDFKQKPLVIFTPNPEIIMYAQKDMEYMRIINTAQISTADGVGVVWGLKTLGYPIIKRISGADLVSEMINISLKNPVAIGIIGGFTNVAVRAAECLRMKYPKLEVWGKELPEFRIMNYELRIKNYNDNDKDRWFSDLSKEVKSRNTRILLVGLGFPQQEYFIYELSKRLNDIVIISIGAGIDFLAGKKRAPKIIREWGLEWLYKLVTEPWRIKRQLALPKFVIQVLLKKYKFIE